jgi:hypothetical protein
MLQVEELGMETGNSYNVALFIFFVPYILFEGKHETNENAFGGFQL